jgi:hypothetical protein
MHSAVLAENSWPVTVRANWEADEADASPRRDPIDAHTSPSTRSRENIDNMDTSQTSHTRLFLPPTPPPTAPQTTKKNWIVTKVVVHFPVALVPGSWRRKVSMRNLRPVFERISGKPKNPRHPRLEFLLLGLWNDLCSSCPSRDYLSKEDWTW